MKLRAASRGGRIARAVALGLAVIGAGWGVGSCGRPTTAAPLHVSRVFGEVGISPGQFSYPRCIDAAWGEVWVIDKLARVQRFDAERGVCTGGWRMPEWDNGKPTGITLWQPPAGGPARVIIADTHYHRVMIYDPSGAAPPDRMMEARGELRASFGSYGEAEGQFIYPTDVAVMPTPDGKGIGRLYVSEYGGHDRVSVFEPAQGQTPGDERLFVFRFAFGKFGSGTGAEFNRPQAIEFDAERNEVIVTDACNHRIGRFSPDGLVLGWVGHGVGRGPGQMQYPYGIELLGKGRLMVAEFGGNRVQEFDLTTGESLGVYGQAGRHEGELATPWGVAAIDGSVMVLDSGNNRVQVMRLPGGLFSAARSGGGGL